MNAKRECLKKETVNKQLDRMEKDYEHRLSIIKAYKEGKRIEYKVGVCCSAASSEDYGFVKDYSFFVRWLDDDCKQEEV